MCSKDEADKIEQHYIDVLKPSLNSIDVISKSRVCKNEYYKTYDKEKRGSVYCEVCSVTINQVNHYKAHRRTARH